MTEPGAVVIAATDADTRRSDRPASPGPVRQSAPACACAHPAVTPADATHAEGGMDRGSTAADAMIRAPRLHAGTATVADVRAIFRDDHVHCVVIVDDGRLLA
ncbi:MAG: hypothetical protein ACRDSS_15350, partial [Actinocrinis sp.]